MKNSKIEIRFFTFIKMAFGSFFKKIITGAKNLIGKIGPAVKKGLDAVSKIAPAIATGAAAFGGPIGAAIGGVANTVGNIAGGISKVIDGAPKPMLGVNGAGRFAIPLLK